MSTAQRDRVAALREALATRVVVSDGAMGTMLQEQDPTLEDFQQLEGCNEVLNATRPDIVRSVHQAYFDAGVDMVETNTFGANATAMSEYDIPDRIVELSESGARIAREVADEFTARTGQQRWVLGSIGPGTKLPTLGHISYDLIRDGYQQNAEGLIAGGSDALIVETSQDLLQTKAAVIGARKALEATGVDLPVLVSLAFETTGVMLVGSEIGAALTALEPLGIDMIGLNCSTGPAEMNEHLRYLARHSRIPLLCMPNAGLPVLTKNGAHFPLGPEGLADAQQDFVTGYGLSLIGGCCGTTPAHMREVVERVRGLTPTPRTPQAEPGAASIYQTVPFRQDSAYMAIGERTNANGSKKFRDAMLEARWDDCVEIARDQIREGAHMLDLCIDYVGRDGVADMEELAGRFATASTLPIVLDSTEVEVIRAGLEKLGGRAVINSVNFEDGDGPESRFAKVTKLAQEHGAALIALTIDEEGQARTVEKKVEIAQRLIAELTGNWGIREEDILVDTLTFTICTGQEESRGDGIATIEAIRELKRRHRAQLRLPRRVRQGGPGLRDRARLQDPAHRASGRGAGPGRPRPDLRPPRRGLRPAAEADGPLRGRHHPVPEGGPRRGTGRAAAGRAAPAPDHRRREEGPGGRPRRGPPDPAGPGDRQQHPPGGHEGRRRALRLRPDAAPVRPPVRRGHEDRYNVVNIGIKQPVSAILEAAEQHNADIIGMSGLLVKSTVIMKENLAELNARGLAERFPVILGGAALTRAYVEQDLHDLYQGEVRYARDAFEGLRLMDALMGVKRGVPGATLPELKQRRVRPVAKLAVEERPVREGSIRSDVATDNKVPVPPFWGDRVVKGIPLKEYASWLDEDALFKGQWGLKPARKGDGPSYEELVETEGRPRLRGWLDRLQTDNLLEAAVVHGYYRSVSKGDDLILLDELGGERTRFTFPRQDRGRHLCLADFFRPEESGEVDVVGLQVVTVGSRIGEVTAELFAADSYRDYLELHGLSVQLAEALAEYWHARVRAELGIGGDDPSDLHGMFRTEYQGCRYSLGYPACPDLEDRAKIAGLLQPERIGVHLSEEFQLHPEQSTDAIVVHHPEANYFNAGGRS